MLAALGIAAARLPQAIAQLRRFLDEQTTAGRVRIVDGTHAGDPAAVIAETGHLLDHATLSARGLAQLLDAATDTLHLGRRQHRHPRPRHRTRALTVSLSSPRVP